MGCAPRLLSVAHSSQRPRHDYIEHCSSAANKQWSFRYGDTDNCISPDVWRFKSTSPFATILAHPSYSVHVRAIGKHARAIMPSIHLLWSRHTVHSRCQIDAPSRVYKAIRRSYQTVQKSEVIHVYRSFLPLSPLSWKRSGVERIENSCTIIQRALPGNTFGTIQRYTKLDSLAGKLECHECLAQVVEKRSTNVNEFSPLRECEIASRHP